MRERLLAGIDLGGTKASAVLATAGGTQLARAKEPVEGSSLESTARQCAALLERVMAQASVRKEDISGIGVCVPGIFSAATGNAWAPNLWGWDEVPLKPALDAALPAPVFIDSDRSAYVLGEQWLGAAQGLTDVVFLAVGTGIGAGILTSGRLCRGAAGIAGAVGWFALDTGWKDSYARTGCFEAEAAGPAVGRRAEERLASGEHSLMREIAGGGPVSAEQVAAAARKGDALALSVIEDTATFLAMGIANLVSVLNPQMVVLGGGLMQAGDLLLEPVRRLFPLWAQPIAARQVRIELSRLGEDAGLLGAARLPLAAQI